MDQDGIWHGGRSQPRRLCVTWGLNSLTKKGTEPPPQFSAHFYCGQTAGCIKMPLGIEVGLIPGDFVFDGDPASSPKRRRSPPIFGPCLLRPNGWMDQDATWYGGRPRPKRLCVTWGLNPLPKKGTEPPPQFSSHFYCGQTAGWIKMALGMRVGLSPRHIVLDGDPAPLPQKGAELPQFSAHFGETAGCIKMSLGMEVGLSPGDFVLDGDPVPLRKNGVEPPNFRPTHIVLKRLHGSRFRLVRR